MEFLYDVAISFLSGDEPLATQLYDALSENLRVFVYSKKQEQIAGREGLEVFRQAFFSQSRLQVVLYRETWGKTDWTAIEELAIKERMLHRGWESLLFVMLDSSSPPVWLPDSRIHLNFNQFGDALVGAIKFRAQELGSMLVAETAFDRAKRAESNACMRQERESQLARNAANAIPSEWRSLCKQLEQKLSAIRPVLPSAEVEYFSHNEEYLVRTSLVSALLHLSFSSPASGSFVLVCLYIGRRIPPGKSYGRMHVPGEEPDCVSKVRFSIDYNSVLNWCWRSENLRDPLFDAAALSEHVIKETVKLHEDVETGKMTRSIKTRVPPTSAWN